MNSDRSFGRAGSLRRHLVEEELTRKIIGAFFEVYNALGFGFLAQAIVVQRWCAGVIY